MTDFLLELLSEEIPARMQEKACADLQRLFEGEIAKAGLRAAAIESYATPRRLALIARGLPDATDAIIEEIKGPRADAPTQAIDGFLAKNRLSFSQLVTRSDAKGQQVLYAIVERFGRETIDVLADAIPALIRAFPWPKSMRWGAASASTTSLRWVRPLQGIVALLGEEVVPFEVDGIASGAATVGHRFHHPGPITIGSAHDYAEKLRACHVILDPAERRRIIADGAGALAEARGLQVVADAGLVAENAGLTEWPVPLLGDFDPAFLEVPREVIQLTMRTNQKYFACVAEDGTLAPSFICTANIQAVDGGAAIVAGNRKVLAARLADARFFWEQDLKVPLEEQAKKLAGIVFHEKLGTLADKVDRVAKLARWLVEEGIVGGGSSPSSATNHVIPAHAGISDGEASGQPHAMPASAGMTQEKLADMAEQAARLCKADLVTGMVGEFPELQGIMGGYYARAEGLPPEVADAIRDHYKPVGQGDDVPTAPVTVAVSLADKLDTVAGFFIADMPPSGSKDPFALRRASIAISNILVENAMRLPLSKVASQCFRLFRWQIDQLWKQDSRYVSRGFLEQMRQLLSSSIASYYEMIGSWSFQETLKVDEFAGRLVDAIRFITDRLKVQQREAGVRHDLIDAVFALGGEDDLVRLLARVRALQAFVGTEDGANLLAGYKRAANILRKEGWGEGERQGLESGISSATAAADPAPEEAALIAALNRIEPEAARAVAAEDFAGAMAALARLRAPIDAFFEHVTVNDPDPAKRAARLALLARMRAAVHQVADFSKIEG